MRALCALLSQLADIVLDNHQNMTQIKHPAFTQAQVEQRTGLSRELLRKWELRYNFPQPSRGARGQRHYSGAEMQKLALISRLLPCGLRASALVAMPLAALQARLDHHAVQAAQSISPHTLTQATQALLASLQPGQNLDAPRLLLQAQLDSHGLNTFVADLMPTFNAAVGQSWQAQRLSIAAEHHYTATLRALVQRALPLPDLHPRPPKVLLTTPPGELHSLGLLALQAQLALQGAPCINLDSQLPAPEVLRMVREAGVGVVAISASVCMPVAQLTSYVAELVQGLPASCALWLGGQGCAALPLPRAANVTLFQDTTGAVSHWLSLAQTL